MTNKKKQGNKENCIEKRVGQHKVKLNFQPEPDEQALRVIQQLLFSVSHHDSCTV